MHDTRVGAELVVHLPGERAMKRNLIGLLIIMFSRIKAPALELVNGIMATAELTEGLQVTLRSGTETLVLQLPESIDRRDLSNLQKHLDSPSEFTRGDRLKTFERQDRAVGALLTKVEFHRVFRVLLARLTD